MYESDCPRQARIVQEREINDVQKMEQEKSVLSLGWPGRDRGRHPSGCRLRHRGRLRGSASCRASGIGHEIPRGQGVAHRGRCPVPGRPCPVSHPLPRLVSCTPRDEPGARHLRERAGRIMGLIELAAGALQQVARTPISDLHHAPGATVPTVVTSCRRRTSATR
jgi:hypothetical protein